MPRPWVADGDRIISPNAYGPDEPGSVLPGATRSEIALIVEAVNNYERWLAIEAAARTLLATRSANVTGPDYQARKSAYATLREALEIE
jgi:hypothetical protein